MPQSKRYDVPTEALRGELEKLVPLLLCCNKKFSKSHLEDLKTFATYTGPINPIYLNNLICLFNEFIHKDDIVNGGLHKTNINISKTALLLRNFILKERILDTNLKTTDWEDPYSQEYTNHLLMDYLADLRSLLTNNQEMVGIIKGAPWWRIDHHVSITVFKLFMKLFRNIVYGKVHKLINGDVHETT